MPQRTISSEDVVRELLRGTKPESHKQRIILLGTSSGGSGTGPITETPPGRVYMRNPMTALGSLIVGGVAGAPKERLIGTEGQVLMVISGEPDWGNSPSGLPGSPATGDIVYYNGTDWVVLAIGT